MARIQNRALPVGVRQLGERIEHWRRTRARRTFMPAELWSAAVELGHSHGAYRVAHGLRISFVCLRRRMAEAPPSVRPIAPSGEFVELTRAQIPSTSVPSGTVIELSDRTGIRLTLRLGADVQLDVASVVAAFRRRGA